MNFIQICGNNSEIVGKTLLSAFEKADISRDEITVMWGKSVYTNIPENVETTILLLSNFFEMDLISDIKNVKRIIAPFNLKDDLNITDCDILTYAQDINNADFVAKNLTEHDDISFFELLAFNNIGRIYYDSKKYSCPQDILACAAVLLTLDVKFGKVIQGLTAEIKR